VAFHHYQRHILLLVH